MATAPLNPGLVHELKLLLKAKKWNVLRAWFITYDSKGGNEPILLQDGSFIDSGVPIEKIDKILLWFKTFMPSYFSSEFAWFQRQLITRFFSDHNEYMAAPRGFSKTTTLQGCTAFAVANKLETFIVFIEKTLEEAGEVLTTVRDEFEQNKMILVIYGDVLGDKRTSALQIESKKKAKDSQDDVFINGVRLRAKGWDQSPRGLKSREHRPSLIILDDVEKDKHIDSEYQRDKYMKWFNRSVVPALAIDGAVKVFGTILHEDAMLMHLIRIHNGVIFRAWYDPSDLEFDYMELPIHADDVDGKVRKVLWPSRWPWSLLKKKVASMLDKNLSMTDAIQELKNQPISAEDAVFKRESVRREDRFITLEKISKKRKNLAGFCAIDVADSTRETSDWTGVVVWLIDDDGNRYRSDVRRERRDVLGQINLIFEIWTKWVPYGLMSIGIEKKAFDDVVRPLFNEECRKRGVYPVIKELKPRGRNKEARIAGALQGMYEQGKIWTVGEWKEVVDDRTSVARKLFIPVGDTEHLWNELEKFPRAQHDDLSDAEAYLPEFMTIPFKQEKTLDRHVEPSADPFEKHRGGRQSRVDDLFAEYGTINNSQMTADPYL